MGTHPPRRALPLPHSVAIRLIHLSLHWIAIVECEPVTYRPDPFIYPFPNMLHWHPQVVPALPLTLHLWWRHANNDQASGSSSNGFGKCTRTVQEVSVLHNASILVPRNMSFPKGRHLKTDGILCPRCQPASDAWRSCTSASLSWRWSSERTLDSTATVGNGTGSSSPTMSQSSQLCRPLSASIHLRNNAVEHTWWWATAGHLLENVVARARRVMRYMEGATTKIVVTPMKCRSRF
jgi:hypothetical protein